MSVGRVHFNRPVEGPSWTAVAEDWLAPWRPHPPDDCARVATARSQVAEDTGQGSQAREDGQEDSSRSFPSCYWKKGLCWPRVLVLAPRPNGSSELCVRPPPPGSHKRSLSLGDKELSRSSPAPALEQPFRDRSNTLSEKPALPVIRDKYKDLTGEVEVSRPTRKGGGGMGTPRQGKPGQRWEPQQEIL